LNILRNSPVVGFISTITLLLDTYFSLVLPEPAAWHGRQTFARSCGRYNQSFVVSQVINAPLKPPQTFAGCAERQITRFAQNSSDFSRIVVMVNVPPLCARFGSLARRTFSTLRLEQSVKFVKRYAVNCPKFGIFNFFRVFLPPFLRGVAHTFSTPAKRPIPSLRLVKLRDRLIFKAMWTNLESVLSLVVLFHTDSKTPLQNAVLFLFS
jgi:hypothetical protein